MSPARKRQGGAQISPATSRTRVASRSTLKETDDKDYVVDKKVQVGEGSFATVCMGRKISTGEKLAVKVIAKANVPPEMTHLIECEFDMIRKLNHRNVISVEHASEDEDFIYIYMPYYGGGDLHSFIDDYDYLAEKVAFKIFYQLVDAVDHCHLNDIIHRDIKLENMLMDNPEEMNITLIDFGFSIERKGTDPLLDDFPGSPAYAAPELMQVFFSFFFFFFFFFFFSFLSLFHFPLSSPLFLIPLPSGHPLPWLLLRRLGHGRRPLHLCHRRIPLLVR